MQEIPSAIGAMLLPGSPRSSLLQGSILLALAAVGSVRSWRLGGRLLPLFVIGSVAMCGIVPWSPERFVLPLLPPLLVLTVAGARALATRWSAAGWSFARRLPAIAGATVVATQLAMIAFGLAALEHESVPHHALLTTGKREWSGYLDAFAWTRANVPPEDGIGAGHDALWYLYTGRRSVRYWKVRPAALWLDQTLGRPPRPEDPERLLAELDRLGVRWLVVEAGTADLVPGGVRAVELAHRIRALPEAGARRVFRTAAGGLEIWELHADRAGGRGGPQAGLAGDGAPRSGSPTSRPAAHHAPQASRKPG